MIPVRDVSTFPSQACGGELRQTREFRMFSSRLRRVIGSVAIAAMLLLPASGVATAAASTCTMTVSPASGPPGTMFTFKGHGYTPKELQLSQGSTSRSVTVSLNGADPWTYSITAGDKDTGRWKVIAATGDAGCLATAQIRVTLPPTSTLDPSAPADRTPAIAVLAGLAIVFVVSAGLIFRRSRHLV